MRAVQRTVDALGGLHASLPAITAAEPVWGMVLGIVVFCEKVPTSPGMIALQAGGVVALVPIPR